MDVSLPPNLIRSCILLLGAYEGHGSSPRANGQTSTYLRLRGKCNPVIKDVCLGYFLSLLNQGGLIVSFIEMPKQHVRVKFKFIFYGQGSEKIKK